jgi:hypothetical protein
MRFGKVEIPAGILVRPAIVPVLAALLIWSWYCHSKQTDEVQHPAMVRAGAPKRLAGSAERTL